MHIHGASVGFDDEYSIHIRALELAGELSRGNLQFRNAFDKQMMQYDLSEDFDSLSRPATRGRSN